MVVILTPIVLMVVGIPGLDYSHYKTNAWPHPSSLPMCKGRPTRRSRGSDEC